ncbi:MAG: SGNH/GDSL hydrolase family protein [Lentisphaeria bacterium]|nr:SGNH/GDSL hydrolase family protein [Lentisphaeria bacterium]
MKNSAAKYDKAMAAGVTAAEELKFITPETGPLRLSGFAFGKCDGKLRRLPEDERFSDGVKILSWNTAGGRVDFRTDSTRLQIKVKLHTSSHMDHMPDVGSCGFDLYAGEPGKSVMIGTSRSKAGSDEYESSLHNDTLPGKMENYTINFPLYSGIESLLIGIDANARMLPPAPWQSERPMVFYGTSITQGGCASRPGMAYPAILSRRFNIPALNFGFSGNGKGEPVMAEYLAKITDPAFYLLDYEPNARPEGIKETLSKFIDILREKHPETPIFVMSSLRFNREIPITGSPDIQAEILAESVRFQRAEVQRRKRAGDKNIYFINGGKVAGKNWHEFAVDGCHQTDLGFYMIANNLEKILKKVL